MGVLAGEGVRGGVIGVGVLAGDVLFGCRGG